MVLKQMKCEDVHWIQVAQDRMQLRPCELLLFLLLLLFI
jgi:hypothetical protein